MKVIKLNTSQKQTATEKFISALLITDLNAFKSTSYQFLRNNQAYIPQFTGLIA